MLGVVVELRTGKVVRYRSATGFNTGATGVYVKRETQRKKTKRNRYPPKLVKTLAYYPVSSVARVELIGVGNPPPRTVPKPRGKKEKK